MTFASTRTSCLSLGGDLAVIRSEGIGRVVSSYFTSGDIWIGYARTIVPCGPFGWVDGSAYSYTNWASGEPDCGGFEEACAVASIQDGQLVWRDELCGAMYVGLCSVDGKYIF